MINNLLVLSWLLTFGEAHYSYQHYVSPLLITNISLVSQLSVFVVSIVITFTNINWVLSIKKLGPIMNANTKFSFTYSKG